MATIGQAWLTVGAYALMGAGYLFDVLVKNVIVDFRGMLGPEGLNVTSVIGTVWTLFRDAANIMIIGIFVFIAVSLILGLKEFGQKKLIANVLIVAVLLNFSLLFTTLIIDGSNFVAKQFYQAIAQSNTSFNIAQGFLKPMGITSVWQDSGKITDEVAKKSDSGWEAFLFGLTGGILLIVVAGVMLYGCFLIAMRGVLFFVLMVVSAAAFATYLIPSLSNGQYGFKVWLKTLLNTAIFAPLLMLSLAASLAVIVAAQPKGSSAVALGAITANPSTLSTPGAWHTILLYLFGTALLFISFRLSSKFAGTLSGFNLAALATMAIPAMWGGRLAAGAAGAAARQSAGRVAYNRSQTFQKQAREANAMAGFHTSEAEKFTKALQDAQKRGDAKGVKDAQTSLSTANMLADRFTTQATKLARKSAASMETANKTYAFAGDSKEKSFAQRKQEQAKQAAKIAEIARPGDDEKEKARKNATDEARKGQAENLKNITETRDRTRAEADKKQKEYDEALKATTPPQLQAEKKRTLDALRTAQEKGAQLVREHDRAIGDKLREIEAAPDAEKQRLQRELSELQKNHASEQQVSRLTLSRAEKEAAEIEQQIQAPIKAALGVLESANKIAKDAQSKLEDAHTSIERVGENRAKTIEIGAKISTAEIAGKVGKKIGGLVDGARVSELARAQYKKQNDAKSQLRKLIKDTDTLPSDNNQTT